MSTSYKLLISLIIGLLAFSCTDRHHDKRLTRISEIVSDSPKEAMERLDSINVKQLSNADRHFYDFLTIKARDKAYVYHTSDSLILDVIDYYSSHDKALYPEALYYGGRVYSDLGDYATSLKYFQEALDQIPPDTKDLDLKCRLLSQTGRLLNTLCLYEEAVPYIHTVIEVDRQRKDTVNTIYDLQLLGSLYLRAGIYDKAEKCFKETLTLGMHFPQEHSATTRMYLAEIKYETGQIDSAVSLIRNVPSQVDSIVCNTALAYASKIYLKAGILDTAYIYADELIRSQDHANKESGYHVLLSSDLYKKLPQDSVSAYLSNYIRLLNSYYNRHNSQLTIEQAARYNYQVHERERIKAEQSRDMFKDIIIAFLIGILIWGGIYYKQKLQSKQLIIELQNTISNLSKIETSAEPINPHTNSYDTAVTIPVHSSLSTPKPTEQELREELLYTVKSKLETTRDNCSVHTQIIESDAYTKLKNLITKEKILKDTDPFWKEIEETVNKTFPHFLGSLNVLTSGKLKDVELQTALLIKFGIRPSQMMILFGKSNGAINSRRETLGIKIFGKKVSVKEVDKLICYL